MLIKVESMARNNTYIELNLTNSMWNKGHISVVVNNNLIEHISVDDYLETNDKDDIVGADDIVELLKYKYNIKRVKIIEDNFIK